jgi:two-component system sensor histidine kinase RegB
VPKRHANREAAPLIALPWIMSLRYAGAAGQVAAVLTTRYLLGIRLPVGWMLVVPALVVVSNLWGARVASGRARPLVVGFFLLDIFGLTALLGMSGGAANPFTLLYLVQVTLAAVILRRRETWAMGALSALCYAGLFAVGGRVPELEMHAHGSGASLHLVGMWIAFAVAAALVALFSGKISELLREHEESQRRMQEELARKDRLAALATLAAGAAHELSTPLGTIAVVARELERHATQVSGDEAVAEDSRLVRQEVERCREILGRMRLEGAQPGGEPLVDVEAGALLESVARQARAGEQLRIRLPETGAPRLPAIPRHATEQAVLALVKNALEAGEGKPVEIAVHEEPGAVRIEVRDAGRGMTAETLRHAGEPFFTTREPGQGMGLGVFLVRTLAESLGGGLELQSAPGEGTVAALRLPRRGLA